MQMYDEGFMSDQEVELKHVPLEEVHIEAGGKMVPFAGFLMPVQYTGIKQEHLAVRHKAGLFDVSHMGEVEVRGKDALKVVDYLVTNDVFQLKDGQALYTVMCHPNGGVVDDLLVYRLGEEHILLCINAANREKDVAYILKSAPSDADVTITDTSDEWAQLALQGPEAKRILAKITSLDLDSIAYFHAKFGDVAGVQDVLVSHTGYTGEDGFELYIPVGGSRQIFEAIVEAGGDDLLLCGLGCRDTLRLEAKLHLYGQDLSDDINPLEAGLTWTVKLNTGRDFIGKEALLKIKEEGVSKRLRGLIVEGKGIIRQGYEVYAEDQETLIGEVVSGSFSYMLETSVGLSYIKAEYLGEENVLVKVRSKFLPAKVTKKAFYKNT